MTTPTPTHNHTRTDTSSTSSATSSPLPFPEPLPRSSFLTPHFDPQDFLSSLGPRHQTLEDLREDLQSRSQHLSQDLLELVNGHYAEFLSLGSSVQGQAGKVEELRVGLMGVRREVVGSRAVVAEREEEVGGWLRELREVRREMERGRRLLAWEEGVGRLEGRLGAEGGEEEEEEWDSEASSSSSSSSSSEGEGHAGRSVGWFKRRGNEYMRLLAQAKRLGVEHPFIIALQSRLGSLRGTLVGQLEGALKAARERGDMDGVVDLLVLIGEVRR